MFSRAAKSIVKSLGQRKYHAGEENLKVAMLGGAGEMSRTLSQMLKQSSKLDVLALYDIAAANKKYFPNSSRTYSFCDGESFNPSNSRMLTMLEKSRVDKECRTDGFQNCETVSSKLMANSGQKQTEELVQALQRLPIAEGSSNQSTRSNKMLSQEDNAYSSKTQDARVLGEMGPNKFRHPGPIISEIYKQFPDFAVYPDKDYSKNLDVMPTQWTKNLKTERSVLDFVAYPDKICVKHVNTIFAKVKKNHKTEVHITNRKVNTEKTAKKNFNSERQITDCTVNSSIDCLKTEKSDVMPSLGWDKRKNRTKKAKENKMGIMPKVEQRGKHEGKSRNWTIPAAFSDKKPKLLQDLVNPKRKPITWFFSKIFGSSVSEDSQGFDNTSHKINKLSSTQNQKAKGFNDDRKMEEPLSQDQPSTQNNEGKLNAATSVQTLMTAGFTNGLEGASAGDQSGNGGSMIDQSGGNNFKSGLSGLHCPAIDEKMESNDIEESETASDITEVHRPMQNVSSRIALFLEKLTANRKRAHSVSSLVSYDLDSLFTIDEPIPLFSSGIVLSSASDCGSKSNFRDRLEKLCKKNNANKKDDICDKKKSTCKKIESSCKRSTETKSAGCSKPKNDTCKKRSKEKTCKNQKRSSSCGTGGNDDPCRNIRKDKHQGPPCKKYSEDATYGKKEDPCKKFRDEKFHGPLCKTDAEDPCKKLRREEHQGKACKQYEKGDVDREGDPCMKFRKEDSHGPLCKKPKSTNNCNKSRNSCSNNKKASSCGGKKESNDCKGGKKQSNDCNGGKRESNDCNGGKRESNDCNGGKKPPPCKTEKPAPKADNCSEIKKGESTEKKDCPPVIRAPGCPNGGGKKGGNGPKSSRGYSTFAPRIDYQNDLIDKNLSKLVFKDFSIATNAFSLSELDYRKPRKSNVKSCNSNNLDVFALLYGKQL